jgi:hypothetical protein
MRVRLSILLAIAMLSSCRQHGDKSTRDYQQYSSNQAHISCPSIKLETFRDTAKDFARRKGLEYQDRADNPPGTLFVITMHDQHQEIWLTGADATALLSQHLESGVKATNGDRQLFDELVKMLGKCGRG